MIRELTRDYPRKDIRYLGVKFNKLIFEVAFEAGRIDIDSHSEGKLDFQ
jgi:hypothetical protein